GEPGTHEHWPPPAPPSPLRRGRVGEGEYGFRVRSSGPSRNDPCFDGGDAMAASSKIRVGIVGASASRGVAQIAHMPALKALPQFETVAVGPSRRETAEAAARHYGARFAFADAGEMARHPDIDLVTVSVKVPDHLAPVMAAIEAKKHVYCEWPL